MSDVGFLAKIPPHSLKTQSPKQNKLNYTGQSGFAPTQKTQIKRLDLGLDPPVPSYNVATEYKAKNISMQQGSERERGGGGVVSSCPPRGTSGGLGRS